MEIEKTIEFVNIVRYAFDPSSGKPKGLESVNWFDFFEFVTQHEIAGILYEGMKRLKDEGTPILDEILSMWTRSYDRIEKESIEVFNNSAKLVEFLSRDGLSSCILKGQACALYYPNVYSRTPEGICVWLTTPNYETKKIIEYVKRKNPRGVAKYNYSYYGKFGTSDVEVHYRPAYMFNPYNNAKLRAWIASHREEQFAHCIELPDEAGTISVPTWEFSAVTQLATMFGHALNEGFDLRQVIDYYFLLKSVSDESKKNLPLNDLGLRKFAEAVMWILHEMLGLEEIYLIAKMDDRRGWILLEEMLRGPQRSVYFRGKIRTVRKVRKVWLSVKRNLKMLLYYPSEVAWMPFFRIFHFFWQMRNN